MHIYQKFNYFITIVPFLLFSLGYMALLSTSVESARAQLVYFIIGIVAFILVSLVDYTVVLEYSKYFFIFSVILLIITFVLGEATLGSVRWLRIGFLSIQPSELVKLAFVIYLPRFLALTSPRGFTLKSILKTVCYFMPVALLVLIQPDFGSFFVIFMTFIVMLFSAGLNLWYFVACFIGVGLLSSPLWNALHDYQRYRVLVFINPSLDVLGRGYNVIQSLISIGSGGLFGKGFGKGTQTHLNYLPVYWTDFIFAAFSEEWGFIGSLILILLFCVLLGSIWFVVYTVKDREAALICIGVLAIFFVQFFVNLGMNMGLLPVTGITLPLISSGGTSIVISMCLLGLVNSVWVHRTR